ncbi:NIF3 protein [Staphylococcus gallinarum]|uniref:GTP cyclohydrolase 1 type 2 homolog n=1 Tax=Staphylococcus gallinarum TaxID=1293 RepID=A0A380FJA3_STAGA|nr:NIF3 protein [Staphylococcus gallinarum]
MNKMVMEAIIRKIIQNNINLIAMHTNLDVYPKGVNAMFRRKVRFTKYANFKP